MYNNFLSKKSKKAISALLASALVITAAPINAEAATTKTLGVGKSFTVTAASAKSKITGLSAAEKKIVSVTRKNSKSKVYTIKAKTAGKVTFKIGAKTVKVNAGATKIFRNGSSKVTVTAGKYTNLDVRTAYGKGDTLTFTSSNSKVASIVKGKTTAKVKYNKSNSITKNTKALKAVKAGKATITIKSKNTGKSYKLYVTVKAATPKATATPVVTTNAPATPVVTETVPATTTAAAVTETPVATATAPAVTASAPAVTSTPVPTTGATITNTPVATATATAPAVTETPVQTATAPAITPTAPVQTQAPEVATPSVVSIGAVNTQGDAVDANNVPVNGVLKITFSEKVDASSVNSTNIKVYNAETNRAMSVPSSDITVDADGKTVSVSLAQAGLDKKATYKVVVSNVLTADKKAFDGATESFTVGAVSVITKITLPGASDSENEIQYNMGQGYDYFTITYDSELDKTTITNNNIKLYNVTTGQELPMTPYLDNTSGKGKITIQISSKFVDKSQYSVVLTGIKTALGANAEEYTHSFAVNAQTPLDEDAINVNTYKTLDNHDLTDGTIIWNKITSGLKEQYRSGDKYADQYYAGFQANIKVVVGLDAASVASNVRLVEKETGAVVDSVIAYNKDAKIITITPKADLKEATEYQIQFLGGLKSSEGIYLKPNKKTNVVDTKTKTFKTFDTTAPTVTNITSANGDTGLNEKEIQTFEVTFSEPVSITERNIVIAYADSDIDTLLTHTISGGAINTPTAGYVPTGNYSVSLKAGTTSTYIVKVNAEALNQDKAYKLRVIGKDLENIKLIDENGAAGTVGKKDQVVIVDKDHNSLKKTAVFPFSTSEKDTVKPFIKNAYAGKKVDSAKLVSGKKTNVAKDDIFTFELSEEITIADTSKIELQKLDGANWTNTGLPFAVDTTTGEADFTSGKNIRTTNAVASSTKKDAVTVQLNIAPKFEDGTYRLYFKEGALKDTAGTPNLSEEYKFEFVATEGDDDYNSTVIKYGTVSNTTFTDKAGNIESVATDGKIYVVFKENKLVKATTENITVKAGDEVVAGDLKEISTSAFDSVFAGATVYEFTPSAELKKNTVYTVSVKDVKDTVGNTIETKEFSFKTVKAANSVASIEISGVKAADGSDSYTNVDRQKTITIKLSDKPAAELAKGTDITLTSADGADTNIASNYKVKKVSDTEYRVEFFNKIADTTTEPLIANSKYTLTVKPCGDGTDTNKKVYSLVTGVTATDDLKPYKDGDIAVGSDPVYDYEGRLTFNNVADSIKVPFNEKIDTSDVKITAKGLLAAGGDGKLVDVMVDATVDATDNKVLVLSKLAAGRYDITISGLKDANGNVADDLTLKLNNDSASVGLAQTAEAKKALSAAKTKVEEYYKDGIVLVRTSSTETTDIAADNALVAAIDDTKLSIACTVNGSDANKWDITLTSTNYDDNDETTTITIAKSKITYTTANINTTKQNIENANYSSANKLKLSTEDQNGFATALNSHLASNVTVTGYSKNTDAQGNAVSYTLTLTDATDSMSVTSTVTIDAVAVQIGG